MAELWPASLPQLPLSDSVSYTPWQNTVRTQMDAGIAKMRRRFTAVGDDVMLAVMCTREQLDTLRTFHDTNVASAFEWKNFALASRPPALYRFKAPPKAMPAGGSVWRVELELERLPGLFAVAPPAEPSQQAAAFAAPANDVEPTITGGTAPGSVLTATAGVWTGAPTPIVIGQWERKFDGLWQAIQNAGALNYTTAHLGPHRYKEVATNSAGTGSAASSPIIIADAANSTPTESPPVMLQMPVSSGSGVLGDPVSTTAGSWGGYPVPTITYQWQQWSGSDWANVSGATASSYTPTTADDYRCAVTATNALGASTVYTDLVTVVAQVTAPANSVAPSISGGTTQGSTLTATSGTWSGNPAPTFAYQWQRYSAGAFVDIAGATATTYVTAHDGEHRVRVTATNSAGTAAAFSAAITIGTSLSAPTMQTAPALSGNAYAGSTIYALPGVWNGSGTIVYAYRWELQDVDTLAWNVISGATASSYATQTAGKHRCVVTASNDGGSASHATNTMSVSAVSGESLVTKTFTGAASDNLNVVTHDPTLSYFDNPNVATELLVIKQATNSVHGGNTSGSLQAVYPNNRTFGARQKVSATVHQTDTTSQVAMVLRYADYNNCIICYLGGAGSTLVQKIAGTSYTHSLGQNIVAGDVISCEINDAGTVCEVRVNGNHTTGGTWPSPITLSGGAQPTGNLAGAGLWGTTSAELSSFTQFSVDDFTGTSQAPTLDYAPQVLGKPTVGETLTTTRGVWFAAPEPTYAYAWQRWDGAAWVAASGTNNAASYAPSTSGDYRCRVTATNAHGARTASSPSVTVSGGTQGTGTYTQARVLFDEVQGASEPMVAKLEFRTTVGGAALGGTAFASSEAGALTAAGMAFDTNADTYWEPSLDADAVPHLGQIFASGQAIAQIALTFPNVESLYTAAAPRTFRLQGWDGAQWITLKTVTNESAWTPGETRTYTV